MAQQPVDNKRLTLFGGDEAWDASDWTASDDRVRGGKSQSYFEVCEKTGRFCGTLDIKTLGGAGFASQRTTGKDREWDLSEYAGIQINTTKGDKKRYTLNLKDTLLPPDPDTGREQASITYECDFELPSQAEPGHAYNRSVFIPFTSFNATYRGRLKEDADPINLKRIKQFSIMMRSFFGAQEGEFSLTLRSICALSQIPPSSTTDAETILIDHAVLEKGGVSMMNSSSTPPKEQHHQSNSPPPPPSLRKAAYFLLGAISLFAVWSVLFPTSCGMLSRSK